MQEEHFIPDSDLPPIDADLAPPTSSAPPEYASRSGGGYHDSEASGEAAGSSAKSKDSARGGSFLMWTMCVLLTLIAFQFLAPYLAEQIQYSLTRGKQRAEHEMASRMLKEVSLDQLSLASQMISQRVGPSVVHINTADERLAADSVELEKLIPDRGDQSRGQGSGVIMDAAGYIVTNKHVVDGAAGIDVRLSDGRTVPAVLIGADALTDIAVIKVDADSLIAAEWGDSSELEVGALVWALGSPFGLQRSITFGILSAKNRAGMAGKPHQDFLQTDAAINPGNSGGPLVDSQGRIIGINTAIVGDAYQGISFSIPSSVVQRVYTELREGKTVSRGWLGVLLEDVTPEVAQRNGLTEPRGALIAQVVNVSGVVSPAYAAGIRPGDIVIQWNDFRIHSPASLSKAVANTKIGSAAKVTVLRDGEQLDLHVAVVQRPPRYN